VAAAGGSVAAAGASVAAGAQAERIASAIKTKIIKLLTLLEIIILLLKE
jgi:hypothetical protein